MRSLPVHCFLVTQLQACEGGLSRDYRGDQCRSFNHRMYDGKRRTWEAIEDPDEPCALICRAEGTDHVVKLGSKLRDGTRCKVGALHVCVDGKCEVRGGESGHYQWT